MHKNTQCHKNTNSEVRTWKYIQLHFHRKSYRQFVGEKMNQHKYTNTDRETKKELNNELINHFSI